MTSQPTPPYPYPPHGSLYRPPVDWTSRCRRAGILMFVVGMLIGLYGIGNFALAYKMSPDEYFRVSQQNMSTMGGSQQPQISPEGLRMAGMMLSAMMLLIGLTFMILSGPTRRGGKGAMMGGLVVAGLVAALSGLMMLMATLLAIMMPPMLIMACCFAVPLGLMVWLFMWLLQAYRAVGAATQAAAMMAYSQQYAQQAGNAGQTGSYPPPGQYPYPPSPQSPSGSASPGGGFGPAPFGLPPPPDQAGGKYGYATRPPDEPKQGRKDDEGHTE